MRNPGAVAGRALALVTEVKDGEGTDGLGRLDPA